MVTNNNPSKRFGSRYGSKVRKNVDEAEKREGECPDCEGELEREAAGIWKCKDCGKKFAGGAYRPDTGAEEMLDKALKVGTEELEEAQEMVEEGE